MTKFVYVCLVVEIPFLYYVIYEFVVFLCYLIAKHNDVEGKERN